jgi:16S rRNA (guanine527-N7)-methyltransferase
MSTSASSEFRDLLVERFALPAGQLDALEAHYQLLLRWNRVLNLTSIHDVREAVERHYCESLFLAERLPPGALRIGDLGSGAGFPGFPIAVYRPDCAVTLVESHQRKAVFLREASRKVANLRVAAQRAEEVRETFDFAVSRAVSYADLVPSLGTLAAHAALLTGAEEPPIRLGFAWEEAIQLRAGSQRFLRIGHRCFT